MAETTNSGDAPFDLDKLKQLVEMMESHGLTEVHLRRGDEQWRLRRGPEVVQIPQQYALPAPAPVAAAPAAAAPSAAPAAAAAAPAAEAGLKNKKRKEKKKKKNRKNIISKKKK
eukprot:TRINITY_DN23981_c0_g1_i1.p3 TRINITY_DN23981_c0_g1~~TRINITY_DN23981_c0_g1_i1.p3  ORF type:complete len:114 (-),score=0.44 TRINITY_DN23981_c0_g1_i1:16-357(-)